MVKKSWLKDERGVLGYAYLFLVMSVVCLVVFGLLSVLIANVASGFLVGLEPVMEMTKDNADKLSDANIAAQINASVDETMNLNASNIIIFQNIAGFVGILAIILICISFYLYNQQQVEGGLGGSPGLR